MLWPKQNAASMNAFYGNPDVNCDGRADTKWEAANLVKIAPPYPLFYPSDDGKNPRRTKFTGLWVHRKCADSLMRCLTAIPKEFSPEEISKYQLDVCGGTYNFRLKRGGNTLSIHSWAAAIDLSHLINYYKRKYSENLNMMPQRAVKIFRNEGWTWGGPWSTADAMHFQAADL